MREPEEMAEETRKARHKAREQLIALRAQTAAARTELVVMRLLMSVARAAASSLEEEGRLSRPVRH
jgi:hypothetical protein